MALPPAVADRAVLAALAACAAVGAILEHRTALGKRVSSCFPSEEDESPFLTCLAYRSE